MATVSEINSSHALESSAIDAKRALEILANKQRNKAAFTRFCPSLLHYFEKSQANLLSAETQRFALFCDSETQLNVFDRQFSAPVYASDAKLVSNSETVNFINAAPYFELYNPRAKEINNALVWPQAPLAPKAEVILVFGLGLGYQLLPLLQAREPKCIVIYEPEESMFQCSLSAADWHSIFTTASYTNTIISLQIGKSGDNVYADLNELKLHFSELNRIYVYRHLSYPESDAVIQDLFSKNGSISFTKDSSRQFLADTASQHHIPLRFNNVTGNQHCEFTLDVSYQQRFAKNLVSFSKFYPEIASIMATYSPQSWQVVIDDTKQFNLLHARRNALFYADAEKEADEAIERFLNTPYQNDTILGQRVPWKFREYVHYKAVAKLQDFFRNVQQQSALVPQKIESLILLGLGSGNYLQALLARRDIKHLYIFEPNLDCLYASLFTTDWFNIFESAKNEHKRIYLNVGGDGSNYFNDVMDQFYRVGAFTIANTYILTAVNTPILRKVASKLREQLKVVLTIGDYYDHAKYGISHTYASFKLGHAWLKANRSDYQQHPATSLPVFIVGNGPSLDTCADYIKEHRDNVIVVSCGTALKPLYHLGITPDFHAEVEQNRSTYRWITQVNDFSYLKKITLISINGIHPDTANLFGKTLLAFKEGEASTTLMLRSITEAETIAALTHAYPTVTNLAVDWLLHAGFKQFYLLGVDLGYVDVNNHHSKLSGYYKQDGTAVYDYAKVHGDSISVTGNFRPVVKTKIEFDVARQTLEQRLKKANPSVEVYNCSDGAFIEGTTPLPLSQILTFKTKANKKITLDNFLQQSCTSLDISEKLVHFESLYCSEQINKTVTTWCELIAQPVTDFESAKMSIDQQWIWFKQQSALPGSNIFYLLYGSANYFLSLMTKLLPEIGQCENELALRALEHFNIILKIWYEYLTNIKDDFQDGSLNLDKTI